MEDTRGLWCWCLRHEEQVLDEVAADLGCFDGMRVVICYEDECDHWEYDAVLGHIDMPGWDTVWMARWDEQSFRRLK